jgi:hypothetical protein
MPYKEWADFERLLSDDLNTYVSRQVPAIFATAAARDAAIPTPVTGQPAYLTSTQAYTVYDGSAWREIARTLLYASLTSTTDNQSVGNASLTTVTVPVVTEDIGGFALGSSALTVPVGAGGLYYIEGACELDTPGATGTGTRELHLKSGATIIRSMRVGAFGNARVPLNLATVERLADGAVITYQVAHSQGASLNLRTTAAMRMPHLSLLRVGR